MIIFNLSKEHVVFVDDLNSAGKLEEIKIWWVTQLTEGPKYGYYPNSLKSFFVIKQNYKEYAKRKSGESNIKTTTEGTGHLVTVLGAVSFKEGYIRNKVLSWKNQLQVLSKIAEIKPQAAYSLYIYIRTQTQIHVFLTNSTWDSRLLTSDWRNIKITFYTSYHRRLHMFTCWNSVTFTSSEIRRVMITEPL